MPHKPTLTSNTDGGRERSLAPAASSGLRKHSVVLHGKLTSITIQDELWNVLKLIAAARGLRMKELVFEIDARRRNADTLSQVAREYALTKMALAISPPIAADDFDRRDMLVYGDGEP